MKLKVTILTTIIILFMFFNMSQAYEIKNNNPTLKTLSVNVGNLDPKFNASIIEYSIAVSESVEKIEITATPVDLNATVKIDGNNNLQTGLNIITIEVTAENGTDKRTYTINVTKGDVTKTNANLKSIKVEGGTLIPDFNKNTIAYIIEKDKTQEKLDITAKPEDSEATVSITDNTNVDNTIYVKCTAADGITTKTYMINAIPGEDVSNNNIQNVENTSSEEENTSIVENTVDNSSNNNLKPQLIFGIVLIVLLIVVMIVIIVSSKLKGMRGGNDK